MLSSAIEAREMTSSIAKLRKFSVSDALCHDPGDRDAILTLIAEWYVNSEADARLLCARQLTRRTLDSPQVQQQGSAGW